MKPTGFSKKNNYKPEAHAMIQSITQDNQNDKVLSEKIQSFFKRFHVTSALKAANAYKKKRTRLYPFFNISSCLYFQTVQCT